MLTAVYCGVPGSYAEEAAILYFGDGAQFITASSFQNAFDRLRDGEADRAVVPIENSSTGAIAAVYDLLGRYGFHIVGEQYVRVRHCLLAKKEAELSDIREVVSHEQGISQSLEFLGQHPEWLRRPVYNTAAAAKMAAESEGLRLAAIASRRAAECYGLKILAVDINSKSQNYTRFVIVSRDPDYEEGSGKVSIAFNLSHVVGSLCGVLEVLGKHGMNLMKIESRPIADRNWEYLFFVDFLTDGGLKGLPELFRELGEHTQTLQILGCYRHRPAEEESA